MAYSGGFKPRPLFSFGPPLRLGMAGFSELFDVKLIAPPSSKEIVEILNANLPEGVTIRGPEALASLAKMM